jgi:glutathione S-transferase
MKLYYAPGACSMAPHILLHEIGKKFQIEKINFADKTTEGGADFKKINAKGYVPTLEIKKGEVLTEVATILQYIADKAKATKILPKAGTMARYRAMENLNFVASELHKSIGSLFNKNFSDDAKKIIKDQRIAPRLDYANTVLGKQKFFSGKTFGAADAYAFTVLNWCGMVGVDLAKWPNVQRYVGEMAKRKSVVAAMKAEGLIQ